MLITCCFFATIQSAIGQCTLSTLNNQEIQILDHDTVSLRFYVSAADEPSLSGFQSVCGVRIQFEHRQLSDVTMTLTSPLGVDVTLVGPALPNGTQAIGPPFTVSHDLNFVPFPSSFVDPDPDLADNWTNNIPFWHTRSQYGGSYYANNGDLGVEHEVGPVLGVWELTVVDHFLNSEGRVTGFEIVFCDTDGVVCNACEATSGSFAVQDTQFICRNETIDLNNFYTDGPNDIGEYNELFLVYGSDGSPATISESPDFSLLPADTYTAYGFSIWADQTDTVAQGFNGVSEQVWLDSVRATGGFLCMDISEPIRVQVTDPTIVNLPVENVCSGDAPFMFNGVAITESGLYIDTLDGCNFIERVEVRISNLAASFESEIISTNCETGRVLYGATVTGGVGTVLYEWSQVGLGIVSMDSLIVIATAADWTLRVRDDICDTTLTIRSEVAGLGFQTTATADPPQFNCLQDSITLSHNSTFVVDSIKWFREGVLIYEGLDDIRVGQEGEYSLEVYGSGCQLADDITLTTDISIPQGTVSVPVINCSSAGVLATVTITSSLSQSIWQNSQGDTIGMSLETPIDIPGMYQLTLVGPNLCDTVILFEVMSDAVLPHIDNVVTGDITLTCDQRSLEIIPSVEETEIIDDFWILGVNDTMNQRDITISDANSYRYVAVGRNGCISSRSLNVVVDTMRPSFAVISDSITCEQSEATLLLTGLQPNVSASFSGFNVLSQTDSTAIVNAVGLVAFTVTNQSNQCAISSSYDVSQSSDIPDVTLGGDSTITCSSPNASLVATFNDGIPSNFFWISPQGDSSFERSIVVPDIGTFVFEAVGANGCSSIQNWKVEHDERVPVIDLPNSYVTTCESTEVNLTIDDLDDIDQALWIVEGDTIETPNLNITTTGNSVELILIGKNGCSAGQVIDILYDTIKPTFSLLADSLDCFQEQVTISTDVVLDHHTFVWGGEGVAAEITPTVMVSEPGAYALVAIDTFTGCSSGLMTIDVMTNYELPSFEVLPVDTITCNRTSVSISLTTPLSNNVLWDLRAGGQLEGPTLLVSDIGFQTFSVVGPNGCSVQDSIELFDDLVKPQVDIESSYFISCNEDQFFLSPDYIDPVSSVLWFFEGGRRTATLTEMITDDSLDSLEVTGLNGCTSVVSFDITVSDDKPNSVINPIDSLICFGERVDVSTAPLASSNHRSLWFRDDVLVDTDVTSVPATESGAYILQVVDTISGCESIDTFNIVVSAAPFQGIDIEVFDETCDGATDGVIRINAINGGVGVVSLSLDDVAVGIETLSDLKPDLYDLHIEDELGCMIDTMLSIEQGGQIGIDVEENLRVERGEKVTILPNFTGDAAVSVMWTGDQGTMSDHLDTLCYVPIVDEKILVVATAASGCIAVDSVFIEVFVDITKIRAYVPNILNRESEVGNDEVVITLSPDIIEISDFSIYDRWGQQVMFVPRISNGETVVAWDGRFENQPVSQGVYIYSYEMLTIHDDRPVMRTGDITIID